MRVLLLVICALSGCASTAPMVPARGENDSETTSTRALGAPARRTSGGRTQNVGLPLTRGQKIGLWAGVAVFLAYLMESDGDDEEGAGATEP